MTNEEIAYTAGLFDGEGSVSIYKESRLFDLNNQYAIKFNLVNTNEEVIDWLIERWHGTKYKDEKALISMGCKMVYRWRLHKVNDILFFLNSIRPYSIIKRKQIDLIIEYRKSFTYHHGTNGVPSEIIKHRESYYKQMKLLNKRGA